MMSHRPSSVMSSSSESSTAPMDFNVCHSLESSVQSPPVRRCQTCRQMRRSFTCADCICVGDISHSRALFKESFCDKKLQLSVYEREKHRYGAIIEENCQPHRQRDELRQYIELTKQRAATRTLIIKRYVIDVADGKTDIIEIKRKCREIREKRNTLPERKKTCIHETKKLKNQIEELRKRLGNLSGGIIELVKERIEDLKNCIFPISEISSSKNQEPKRGGQAAELEEAYCTNYIRGKWVYSNHSVDAFYSIGAPCLPADGNYSQLVEWVQQRQDQNPTPRDDTHEAAFEVAAGLMYITQMTKVLAFFLDLKLPYSICFSEFAAETLTEEGLANKIARLNSNVVFMCASQNVDPTQVQARQTVRNILNLIDHSDFPRIQGFEVSPELTRSVEETFTQHLKLYDVHAELDLVGDSRADQHDSPDEECEWETVASTSLPSSSSIDQSYVYSTTASVMGRTRSTSESFLNSAAAYVSTWFSTSTSQRHE